MSGTTASWFGRPQAIKKAAGNAAKRGMNASNTLRIIPSGTTLLRQSGMPWALFTNCQKKGGFPSLSKKDALTLPERVNGTFTPLECCRYPQNRAFGKGGGRCAPLKILETWLCSSYRSLTSFPF